MSTRPALLLVLAALALAPAPAGAADRLDDMSGSSNAYQFPEIGAPGTPGVTRSYSLPRTASVNYCPWMTWTDGRGTLNLQDPGHDPGSCVFKSDVKSRQCDCSTYYWRDVHLGNINKDVNNPSFSYTDYEEPQYGSQCVSYRYSASVADNGNGNYSPIVTPYCP